MRYISGKPLINMQCVVMLVAGREIGVILLRIESLRPSLISGVKNFAQFRFFWTVGFICYAFPQFYSGWLVMEPT